MEAIFEDKAKKG